MFIYIFCYVNLNILQFIVHQMMIKQPSQTNFKNKSRQKLKSNSRGSQPKPEASYKKMCRVDPIINKTSKSKVKQQRQSSKLKIQKNKPQSSHLKARNEQKSTCDNYGLNMKADLKHLINKNTHLKQKNTDIVPQLLKNIQKNCKALKNIHQKQSLILGKINSVVETNGKKDSRSKIQNKSHDLNIKPKKSNSKQTNKKQLYQPKINRFSLSLNHNEVEKEQEQHPLKEKTKKKAVESDSKNFVEVFKLYKKSFDIEDLKIQKSNRKTNYNTNQSKNSSSYYNSHAHSRLGDHSSRTKIKEEQRLNLEKINNLIKNQQKLTDSERKEEHKKQNLGRASMELSRVKQQSEDTNNLRNTVDLISFKKDLEINQHKCQQIDFHNIQNLDFSIHQQREGLHEMQFHQQQGKTKLFENQTISPLIKDLYIPSQISTSKRNSQLNSLEKPNQSSDSGQMQNKFKKSKYYVEMIPRFKQKKVRFQLENLDDSLIGCQIALLEDNVILQDSEIASLQL